MRELPAPEIVQSADNVLELTRIWIVNGSQVFAITPSLWNDSGSWGLLLCDLARQVAAAYEAQGKSKEATLRRIKEAFDAEWEHPT